MLTKKLVLVLNQDSDDLHRSWFQENSAYTEDGFILQSELTKIVPTPKFPLCSLGVHLATDSGQYN